MPSAAGDKYSRHNAAKARSGLFPLEAPSSIAQSQLNTMADRIHASSFDLAEWNRANAKLLPQGEGMLFLNSDHYKIDLHWVEPVKKQERLSLEVYLR